MKKNLILIGIIVCCLVFMIFNLGGCSKTLRLKVGSIDQGNLLTNWPLYRDLAIEYQKESWGLKSDLSSATTLTELQKQKIETISKKWKKVMLDLNSQIAQAAKKVAKKKKLDIVIWKQGLEYGGQDITKEAIKNLEQ